ncbi:MAG: indole-3-glycerol phosphate synthase TrpC [Kiritimatiellia bacterium]
MNLLERIIRQRRADVLVARTRISRETLELQARERIHHSLRDRLRTTPSPRIIAEMKKGSPSAGTLRPEYQPALLARTFQASGAVGISVLTEPHWFGGREEHLREARATVELPILRKDFLCDPYQVAEAAAWGADVVLLIVAALDRSCLRDLYEAALAYGLEVLVEVHRAEELEVALALQQAMIGVNSRNLCTLETNLDVARTLARAIPADRIAVAESGIKTRADIESLAALGYSGFLIGETLLRASDPGAAMRQLLGRS